MRNATEYSPWFTLENDRYVVRHRQVGWRSLAGMHWVSREVQITDKEAQVYDTFSVEYDSTFTLSDAVKALEEGP